MCFNAAVAASHFVPLVWSVERSLYAAVATVRLLGHLCSGGSRSVLINLSRGRRSEHGLGVVIAASLGQMFSPASSLLYNTLYGGLGVFSFTFTTPIHIARVDLKAPSLIPINALSESLSRHRQYLFEWS